MHSIKETMREADQFITQMMIDNGDAPLTADQHRYLRLHYAANKLYDLLMLKGEDNNEQL